MKFSNTRVYIVPISYPMIVDYCSLFACTTLTKIVINVFNDIKFKL